MTTKRMNTEINLFVVGVPKCGTTFLYNLLGQHPKICNPTDKEPHYWACRSGKFKSITNFSNEIETIRRVPTPITDYDEYLSIYDHYDGEKVITDFSTLYMYSDEAMQNIYEYNQQAKILVLLRHPVDRAYSQYMHHIRDGYEWTDDFQNAFENISERRKEGPFWHYKDISLYSNQLKNVYDFFPEDQVKVIIFENFIKNKDQILGQILQFVGLDQDFHPKVSKTLNKTGVPKNRLFYNFLTLSRRSRLFSSFKKIVPDKIKRWIKTLRAKQVEKKELSPEIREMLFETHFVQDVHNLEKKYNINTNYWKS